ncbi:MAG: hypothetical protein FVQ79_02250 [Planctomycetes bacterium]|nr:hypothetical protein [Planctomycetota bacterium]
MSDQVDSDQVVVEGEDDSQTPADLQTTGDKPSLPTPQDFIKILRGDPALLQTFRDIVNERGKQDRNVDKVLKVGDRVEILYDRILELAGVSPEAAALAKQQGRLEQLADAYAKGEINLTSTPSTSEVPVFDGQLRASSLLDRANVSGENRENILAYVGTMVAPTEQAVDNYVLAQLGALSGKPTPNPAQVPVTSDLEGPSSETEQDALQNEYDERKKNTPPARIPELKREFRDKGLVVD